jgi:transposase
MTVPDSPLDPASDHLPDNLPDCHALIRDLRQEVKRLLLIADTVTLLQQRVAELEKQVRRRNRKIFGQSSAKVPAESLTGTGKTLYDSYSAELEAERANLQLVPDEKFHGGGGRNIPKTGVVERIVEHKITDAAVLACPCCGKQRQVFGFTPSYQLDVLKTVFELLKHVEYKYACPDCDSQVIAASKPYQPIDKGYPAPGLISHVGVSKFDWHLPLYRQERIYRAQGVPIARSSMSRWLKEGADILALIVRRMHQLALKSRLMQSDATTMPVIKKGLGKTHKGYTWLYLDEIYSIYDFTETNNGDHPERMLPGYSEVLLTDGAQVYNGVIDNGATRAGCSAHAFRYLEDARKEDPEQADYALAIMKSLFDVEAIGVQLSEDERKALRQRRSKPRLAALRAWIDEQAPCVLPKTAMGEAITYLQNQWEALCLYANTGFVPSHNNASENGLRPAVLGRRNWLFAGSVEGGRTAAVWMSLIQTCRRHSIDPFQYLTDVLTRLPATPTSQIDQFLPDRWKADQTAKADMPPG